MTLPITGRVRDAINILRGEYEGTEFDRGPWQRREAAAEVEKLVNLYERGGTWREYIDRRPDHIPADLWEQWGLENELAVLRDLVTQAGKDLALIQGERDQGIVTAAAGSDEALAQAVRHLAKQAARESQDKHRAYRERMQAMDEARKWEREAKRFQQLAIERGG